MTFQLFDSFTTGLRPTRWFSGICSIDPIDADRYTSMSAIKKQRIRGHTDRMCIKNTVRRTSP